MDTLRLYYSIIYVLYSKYPYIIHTLPIYYIHSPDTVSATQLLLSDILSYIERSLSSFSKWNEGNFFQVKCSKFFPVVLHFVFLSVKRLVSVYRKFFVRKNWDKKIGIKIG